MPEEELKRIVCPKCNGVAVAKGGHIFCMDCGYDSELDPLTPPCGKENDYEHKTRYSKLAGRNGNSI